MKHFTWTVRDVAGSSSNRIKSCADFEMRSLPLVSLCSMQIESQRQILYLSAIFSSTGEERDKSWTKNNLSLESLQHRRRSYLTTAYIRWRVWAGDAAPVSVGAAPGSGRSVSTHICGSLEVDRFCSAGGGTANDPR